MTRSYRKSKISTIITLIAALFLAACGAQWQSPVVFPTATAPDATPADPTVLTSGLPTFDYTPGGEGFGKWATDVTHPDGYTQDQCGRVWQATNLENLPWVTMFCDWQTSDPAPRMQWPHPTSLTVTGTGSVEFELWRDHGADDASNPSPYDTANSKNSPLGLGWFADGFNASICVYPNGNKSDNTCQPLNGGGVFQIGMPEEMTGYYRVVLTVNSGQLHFWQGERVTSINNWPLP